MIRSILAGAILCVIGVDIPVFCLEESPTWTPGIPNPNLTGFWKWDCRDNFGVKIEPAGKDLYSVSFCGPGGCFPPGQWAPNSPIFGDDAYRVLSGDTIEMRRGERFDTLYICPSEERNWKDGGWGTEKREPLGTPGSGVQFKGYGKGLPDLDQNPPFSGHSADQAKRLWRLVSKVRGSAHPCSKDETPAAGAPEVCGATAQEARTRLKGMAKELPKGDFTRLWVVDLDGNGKPELLAEYDTVMTDAGDRYAAFFSFRWRDTDFDATSASWFLEGSLHAVRAFGPTATRKVFIRHLSCTECEPWVYLTVLDLLVPPNGEALQFSYNLEDEKSWGAEIEYVLPGMGHSIDAEVETRLPNPTKPSGPHLLQYFKLERGEDEWWSFTCRGLKCQPTLFKKKPPETFLAVWKTAKPL